MPSADRPAPTSLDRDKNLTDDLVRALWLGLSNRGSELDSYLRRVLPKWEGVAPDFSQRLQELLAQSQHPSSALRRVAPSTEFRSESAFSSSVNQSHQTEDLVRFESPVVLPIEPVWSPELLDELNSIVKERQASRQLAEHGLRPTHTVIFTGLPGVGKTLAARWLARELGLPLAILNLGAVMSSFLGRTGSNLRQVLSFASSQPCVLLLDELDAIAKRRDDQTDIGELKRLVTVLLQELDAWPSEALLVAATNHENLIDPAVWRRFERRVFFPLPQAEQQAELLGRLLGTSWNNLPSTLKHGISVAAAELSPADLTQIALRTKRHLIINSGDFEEHLLKTLAASVASLPLAERRRVGLSLKNLKIGQREISRITGLARETIRGLAK